MEEDKTLKQEIRDLRDLMMQKQKKPFKLPFKAKISSRQMKQGYLVVMEVDENKNINFRKEPVIDGTVKLDDTFHAIRELDIFIYKNKPFIILPKQKLNPYNPLDGKNETYGQKYIMARMKGDIISKKRNVGVGLILGGLVVAALVIYVLVKGV